MEEQNKKSEVVHVRMTAEEKQRVVDLAHKERRSITQLILWLVERYIGEHR